MWSLEHFPPTGQVINFPENFSLILSNITKFPLENTIIIFHHSIVTSFSVFLTPFLFSLEFLGYSMLVTKNVFGLRVEVGWDGLDPDEPVFGWKVTWVGLNPQRFYTL